MTSGWNEGIRTSNRIKEQDARYLEMNGWDFKIGAEKGRIGQGIVHRNLCRR
jgi:hypothetical protein